MIRKLKRRFIFTTMGAITLLLLAVSGFLCLGAHRVIYSDSDQALKRSLVLALGEKTQYPMEAGKERAVVLSIDPETGAIENKSDAMLEHFSEDEQLQMARDLAQGKHDKQSNVRSFVKTKDGKTYVALIDTTMENRLMATALESVGVFALLIWAALFLLVWLLSGWVVRPMAQAWDLQRQFVADVSHDLKTPLTVILSNSELLSQQGQDTPELSRILTAGQRMKELVQQMLTLARLEDSPTFLGETLDLSDMAMETALAFEATAFERGLTINENVEPGLLVKGDRAQTQTLMDCLLDNACKYAAPGSTITLTLEKSGARKVKLTVHNTGSYISPEDLPHIFERFYRADKSRTGSESSGLGLAIVQSIVQRMKGTIWAESDPTAGTAFVVLLPREAA
ncbi:MAG: HAMP domain-containing histidine kinase [Clostridia bacterium]|nr:HAMP domain-containing histidine kinase [Clostridia bacterium]